MTPIVTLALCVGPALADSQRVPPAPAKSNDAAIMAAIIAASIAAYRAGAKGPCACPDDVDRAGRRCGRRSAHSRAGGWTVLCSPSDVTPAMIADWRSKHGGR
ncbi:MAG: hypothetical protein AB7K67_01120 [Hyphomicrobiaceae bacterium]